MEPIRILYVDDNSLDRELVRDALEQEHEGFQVTEASSRQEFEAHLAAGRFDLVLSDFNILGFEGLQVIKAVQASNPDLPVVIVTGTGSEEIAVEAMRSGAADYVIKSPSHIQRLPITIHAVLDKLHLQTEKARAEEKLKNEKQFSEAVIVSLPGLFYIFDENGKFLRCNEALEKASGFSSEDLGGMRPLDLISDETRGAAEMAIKEVFLQGQSMVEAELLAKDGAVASYLFNGKLCVLDGRRFLVGMGCDISELKRLEGQLLQAQKMEAVGRLAGGVAHDFNNILGVIIGQVEIGMMDVSTSDPLFQRLHDILKAALRAADLTRQLLAFARKQTVSPLLLDLSDSVSSMLKMLQRLIGEDIDLAWMPGYDLWKVRVDPSQIDQILANLAVNARDAISGVGKVTIETENVVFDDTYCANHADCVPGEYVMLSVSDDGNGMDQETLAQIFEPFFTTKGVGAGTGLGLATVYGIVRQNNGFINVYSEPGQGTAFKVYLPRCEDDAAQDQAETAAKPLQRGSETVLLVEDEQAILDTGKAILEYLGYSVLTAGTPGEAIRLVQDHPGDIQLLISDVVMPEMNGRELVERLMAMNPGLKCLYISGYTSSVIAHRGVLDEGVNFIQKPFSVQALASKVREVLEG
jgi:PAS domain S-box-containing protein